MAPGRAHRALGRAAALPRPLRSAGPSPKGDQIDRPRSTGGRALHLREGRLQEGRLRRLGRRTYLQLDQYRAALENPPLLVTCDLARIVVHTNFTATRQEVHEIPLEALGEPRHLEILRAVFHAPQKLKPGATSQAVTAEAARRVAELAVALRERGLDPREVARFLDRVVFSLFAEDVGLLPEKVVTRLLAQARPRPETFPERIRGLFEAMRSGGYFGVEARSVGSPSDRGATSSRPAPSSRSPPPSSSAFTRPPASTGAPSTPRSSAPSSSAAWTPASAPSSAPTTPAARTSRPLSGSTRARRPEALPPAHPLDPACGSGNFLYVTLQKLKDLEVISFAWQHDFTGEIPLVGPWQLHGIEINPYAFELAQMTVWIGYLQWTRQNGFGTPDDPVLRPMDTFECKDAILDLGDPGNPQEPEWPRVDFIVGKPPFLGGKRLRKKLGDEYVQRISIPHPSLISEDKGTSPNKHFTLTLKGQAPPILPRQRSGFALMTS